MLSGAACNESCRSRRPGPKRRGVIDSSSRRSCTALGPACPGVIFLSGSAPGSRSTTGSQTGRSEATGPRYFESYASRSTRPARFSMAPLFALTRMRRAEGGHRKQCFGTLSRRRFDQAPQRQGEHRSRERGRGRSRGRLLPRLEAASRDSMPKTRTKPTASGHRLRCRARAQSASAIGDRRGRPGAGDTP